MSVNLVRNQIVSDVQKKRENIKIGYAKEPKRPLVECLVLEMEEDEYLRKFFTILNRHVQRVRCTYGAEYEREAMKLHDTVQKFYAKRVEIAARIKASGLAMNENVLGPMYNLGDFNDGSFGYETNRFDYTDKFGGLRITKDMINNPNDTTFKDRYEKKKAENIGKAERQKELKRRLRIKRLFGRIFTFGRRKVAEEIEDLRYEIDHIGMDLENEEHYERDYQKYRNLTRGQKGLIYQYLVTTDAIDKGVDAIGACFRRFEESKPPITDMEVLEQAFDRMVSNGMNAEDVERVMERIDDVVQKRRLGMYDKKRRITLKKDTLESVFLDKIYGFDESSEKEKYIGGEGSEFYFG